MWELVDSLEDELQQAQSDLEQLRLEVQNQWSRIDTLERERDEALREGDRLRIEIQNVMHTARVTTYAEEVDLVQRMKEGQNCFRDFQNNRRASTRGTPVMKGKGPQGSGSMQPRGTGGVKRPAPAGKGPAEKKGTSQAVCGFCGLSNHTEANCWRKAKKCLKCGSADHQVQECPLRSEEASGEPGKTGVRTAAKKARVPARVYALEAEDVDKESSMVEGTLSISGQVFKVLVDPGYTHSFVNPDYLGKLRDKIETLPFWVEVGTPLGRFELRTDEVCKGCEVNIKGRLFTADMIVLPVLG
ncbi:hypothetical protein [Candidatus Burkholderia verschuerenii]|nr:hypothetical protein [Candidatus Burkholderia verschuerenii]